MNCINRSAHCGEIEDKEESLVVIDADNLAETTLTYLRQGKTKKIS